MTILFVLRIYSATLFLVLCAGYLMNSSSNRLSHWFAWLCLADFCYLLLGTSLRQDTIPFDLGLFVYPLATGTSLAAALFMLWMWRLTKDKKVFPQLLVLAIGIQISIELVNMGCREGGLCLPGYTLESGAGLWSQALADTLEFGFLALGIIWSVAGVNADLVNRRRRLRLILLVPLFCTIAVLEFVPIWFFDADIRSELLFGINTLIYASIGSLVMYLSLFTAFRYFQDISPRPLVQQNASAKRNDTGFEADRERFDRVFVQEKRYRDHKLSVGRLAREMEIPEYRLRKLINEALGYRNFNDLLNHYRVQEFCECAQLEEHCSLPITTLALDAGFSSLTTFNDAFRRQKQMTPSEFRKRQPAKL